MATPIVVTISHQLGAAEAQNRISLGLDKARSDFGAVFNKLDLVWRGHHGDVEVIAAKQTVRAGIDVGERDVRVEINLPWYLAPLQEKIAAIVNARAKDILALGDGTKKSA